MWAKKVNEKQILIFCEYCGNGASFCLHCGGHHTTEGSHQISIPHIKVNFTIYKLTKPFKYIYMPLSHLLPNSGQKLQTETGSV